MDVAVTSALADVVLSVNEPVTPHLVPVSVSSLTPNGTVFANDAEPSLLDLSNDEMEEPRPIRPTSLFVAAPITPSSPTASGELINFSNSDEPESTSSPLLPANDACVSSATVHYENISAAAVHYENFPSDAYAIASPSNEMLEQIADGADGISPLGSYKPFWIPDTDADNCMNCDVRFNVIKRRHHCRACGKVLCAACCGMRTKLQYLENKEARVCNQCYSVLVEFAVNGDLALPLESDSVVSDVLAATNSMNFRPNPNNPSEYCSTVPPLEQQSTNSMTMLPTVLVPGKSSIKKPVGNLAEPRTGERKQVMFSDGIRPGGDLTDEPSSSISTGSRRSKSRVHSPQTESRSHQNTGRSKHRSSSNRTTVSDASGPLPPVIFSKEIAANSTIDTLMSCLRDEQYPPVTFYLCKNLHMLLKLVTLDCCAKKEVWSFASRGLSAVGQDEIAIIIAKVDDEITIPRDVFGLLTNIYDSALRGTVYSAMSHVLFHEGLFGNKENSGFIFVRPTFQCMSKIVIPASPYLVAVLIHKSDVPWAKLFPLRLLLRLGAEYNSYPFPLISYRTRKPAFIEVGHTLLNVLADFRNFQYTLPVIPGLVVHRNVITKKTTVRLPRNRYERISKVLGSGNEHVLAFGANFSLDADSHYTCTQNEEGQHQTQVVSKIPETVPEVTGASFIVFSGALKSTTGMSAKASVVEDGVLVQIPSTSMETLKTALRDMKDYEVACGKIDENPDEIVAFEWTEKDTYFNIGIRSPIDGRSLEGVNSVRIYNGTDYAANKYLIRWTEVFFIENEETGRRVDVDPMKLAGVISQALCSALSPHLEHLVDSGYQKLALRVTLDPDKIGYDVGSSGHTLPTAYVNELDNALIPVIMGSVATAIEELLVIELFFHILLK